MQCPRYSHHDILHHFGFSHPHDAIAESCQCRVFVASLTRCLGREWPPDAVALDDQYPIRQEEVHGVPIKDGLGGVSLSERAQHLSTANSSGLRRDLRRPCDPCRARYRLGFRQTGARDYSTAGCRTCARRAAPSGPGRERIRRRRGGRRACVRTRYSCRSPLATDSRRTASRIRGRQTGQPETEPWDRIALLSFARACPRAKAVGPPWSELLVNGDPQIRRHGLVLRWRYGNTHSSKIYWTKRWDGGRRYVFPQCAQFSDVLPIRHVHEQKRGTEQSLARTARNGDPHRS